MADPVAEAVAPIAAPAAPPPAAEAPAPVVAVAAPAAPVAEVAAPAPPPAPPPAATPASDAPTSILSEAVAKPAATAEPAIATPPVTAEAPAPAAPPPLPTYEALKLPEGVTLDATRVGEFDKLVGQYQIDNNADPAKTQALRQQLADFFIAEQTRSQQALVDQFNNTRKQWVSDFKADPVFGGQNTPATVAAAGALIEQYGGTPAEVAELRHALRVTGLGDHPALIKLFARAGKTLAQEGKPVPATVPRAPNTVSKTAKRYANSLNGNGAS